MRPNLPKSKVKCVLIDKKMPSTCKRILGDLSINYIETKCINTINDR